MRRNQCCAVMLLAMLALAVRWTVPAWGWVCGGATSFEITGPNVVSDPQGMRSCISGTPFSVTIKAKRSDGTTATAYCGTVTISANSSTGGKIVLGTVTFTAADQGVKTVAGLHLNIIYGQNPARILYFDDNVCNVHASVNVAVWFNVFATRENLVCNTVTCGSHVDERDHFVALPADPRPREACGHGVYVRRGTYLETTTWEDRGPRLNDPYWNTTGFPNDTVGIDLADGTFWDTLHMTDNGYVLWRFYG